MHKLKVVPGDGKSTQGTEIYIDGVKVESCTGLTLVAQTNALWHATLELNVMVEGFQIDHTGLDLTSRMYRKASRWELLKALFLPRYKG